MFILHSLCLPPKQPNCHVTCEPPYRFTRSFLLSVVLEYIICVFDNFVNSFLYSMTTFLLHFISMGVMIHEKEVFT
nr:MAG TPA_asm: hypothetical protein [Caudoviricetes sp.]